MVQGLCINFQSEGAKLCYILYLPEAPGERMTLWHMVDAGGNNFAFWFSRTQEDAFLDTFSKNFVFVPQMFSCSAEQWRHPSPLPPGCVGPAMVLVRSVQSNKWQLHNILYKNYYAPTINHTNLRQRDTKIQKNWYLRFANALLKQNTWPKASLLHYKYRYWTLQYPAGKYKITGDLLNQTVII